MAKFVAQTLRGMGQIARQELGLKLNAEVTEYPTRNFDLLQFEYAGSANDLFKLGTVEDIFVMLSKFSLGGQHGDLLAIRAQITEQKAAIAQALALHKTTQQHRNKRKQTARPTFRAIAQAEDAVWRTYRRVDMQKIAEKALAESFPRWKLVEDDADIEFWVLQTGRKLFITLRLSDILLRQRSYKQQTLPASLRPTIAQAMVLLSNPGPDDVFLDPMCGAGTILLERAHAGRYQKLLGGDIRPEAVEATLANFGNKHKPWQIELWDAGQLPLPDASVNKIVTNPPWGKQIGEKTQLKPLYTKVCAEIQRLLVTGGQAVILTSEPDLIRQSLKNTPQLQLVASYKNISVLGQNCTILVLKKT